MTATPRIRSRLRWLVWLAGGLIGVMGVGEIAARVLGPPVQLPLFCTWNPRMGCMTWPNRTITMAMDGQQFTFRTGADGLRNGPIAAKAAGTKRVLVLGDSVVFGPQVPDGEPFANQLGARLHDAHVEVVNAGSVYLRSTDQQLSWFLDVGAALQPDLVLLTFTERNDFADNQRHYWWQKTTRGLQRQVDVAPPGYHKWVLWTNALPFVPWLDAHSRLFALVRLAGWNIMHLPPVTSSERWRENTEDVLLRLDREVRARGAKFAVVVYPSPDHLAALRGERELNPDNDNARILDIVRSHGLPYLDLTPTMQTQNWQGREDGHLTRAGHRAVAELLTPQVQAWLAAPK